MGIRVGFEPHLESINTAFSNYFSRNNGDVEFTMLEKPMRKNSGPFFVFQAAWFRIRSIVDFLKHFDIIHVNSAKFGIVAYIASFFGCRYIYTIHSALTEERKGGFADRVYFFLEIALLKMVARRAKSVTAVSEYCSEEIYRRFKIKPIVTYNGYDDRYFNTGEPAVDVKTKLNLDGRLVFISVGRMIAAKRPVNVIRFFARLKQQHPSAILLFIGEGDQFDAVTAEVEKYDLSNDVLQIRQVPFKEIPDYYRAADYFISACEVEAFGLVGLEALGCGAVPLVPWKGAFPEILIDKQFSYNIDKVEQAVLPSKEELLKQRDSILGRFKWEDKIAVYHQLYLKAMNKMSI